MVEGVVVFSFHPDLFQFDFQHRESPTLLISDRGGKLSQLVFLSQIGAFLFFKGALELVSLCIQSHLAAFIHIRAAVSKERVRELFLETGGFMCVLWSEEDSDRWVSVVCLIWRSELSQMKVWRRLGPLVLYEVDEVLNKWFRQPVSCHFKCLLNKRKLDWTV